MAQDDYMPRFRESWEFASESTALVVVDLQYASASRLHGLGRQHSEEGREAVVEYRFNQIETKVVPNTQRILQRFRDRGLPVIYVANGSRRSDFLDMPPHMRGYAAYLGLTEGSEVYRILDEVAPREDELVLTKTTAGAFYSSGIKNHLDSLGVTDVAVVGVSTNACVDSTARGAAETGFRTVVVSDACTATHEDLHDAALTSFGRLFGTVMTTDELLASMSQATVDAG